MKCRRKHKKRKPGRPPRVVQSKVPMVTQEEINNMAPTIKIAINNMATKIEYEPSPSYLVNVVIDTDTGDILQYKYLTQSKLKEIRYLWQKGFYREFGRLADRFPVK